MAQVIKHVMSSVAEAELGALYINARHAIHIRNVLNKMGHKQPPTRVQVDNSTAVGIVNNKILPKALKPMDMRFHFLRCRWMQGQFRFFWRPGTTNLGDYPSKHHPAAHHRAMRAEFPTPCKYLEDFRARMANLGKRDKVGVNAM